MAELSVRGVSVAFGGVRALNDVSLTVRPGQVNGLIGPNGAGKTTLFNVITGLERPESGSVALDGVDITRRKPFARGRLGLARTFQRLELFGSLSARDNVRVAIETRRRHRGSAAIEARAEELLRRVGVGSVADVAADLLPTGLARLVELARALATDPSVLLLDEPGSGLDHNESAELGRVLTEIAADGVAVLLVEHDMGLVMSVCRHVSVLNFGEIIASGTAAEIQEDPAVRAAYLGDAESLALGDAVPDVALSVRERPAVTSTGATSSASERPIAVEMRELSAAYGRIEVVHKVSMQVPQGSVLAVVGPNGAGKSTLLKVASGQLAPTAGGLLLDGAAVRVKSPRVLARAGLCSIPEGRAIFPNLSVAENLLMYTYRGRQIDRNDLEAASFERFPILAKRRKIPAGRLSGGEQRMLAVARALYTQPSTLLLDELSHGLAPLIVAELYAAIADIVRREKITAIVVEQFATIAFSVADLAAVMTQGHLSEVATPESVQNQLEAAYLGSAESGVR